MASPHPSTLDPPIGLSRASSSYGCAWRVVRTAQLNHYFSFLQYRRSTQRIGASRLHATIVSAGLVVSHNSVRPGTITALGGRSGLDGRNFVGGREDRNIPASPRRRSLWLARTDPISIACICGDVMLPSLSILSHRVRPHFDAHTSDSITYILIYLSATILKSHPSRATLYN